MSVVLRDFLENANALFEPAICHFSRSLTREHMKRRAALRTERIAVDGGDVPHVLLSR